MPSQRSDFSDAKYPFSHEFITLLSPARHKMTHRKVEQSESESRACESYVIMRVKVNSKTLEGIIDYGAVFQTFENQTEQKQTHGAVTRSLLRELERQHILFPSRDTPDEAVSLVDLGCGDGTAAREMVAAFAKIISGKNMESGYETKLNYYGLDAEESFVESTRRSLIDLAADATEKLDILGNVDVRQANVIGTGQLPFSKPINNALVTMGHVLYYAKGNSGTNSSAKDDVAPVVDNVWKFLGRQSMALFVHSAAQCSLGLLRESVAESVVIARPSMCVSDICKERGLDLISFVIPYWIQFPRKLPLEKWEDCKHPERWGLEQNKIDEDFCVLLELLMFIAQRHLRDLVQESIISDFVDGIRRNLDDQDRFEALSDYQLPDF